MSKWSNAPDEGEYKISRENAEKEIREALDVYQISLDNSDDNTAAEKNLDRLVNYYRRGVFENKRDEDKGFVIVQHLADGKTFEYRELRAKDKIAVFEKQNEAERAYTLLGALCGYGFDAVMALRGQDLKAAEALASLFFLGF